MLFAFLFVFFELCKDASISNYYNRKIIILEKSILKFKNLMHDKSINKNDFGIHIKFLIIIFRTKKSFS